MQRCINTWNLPKDTDGPHRTRNPWITEFHSVLSHWGFLLGQFVLSPSSSFPSSAAMSFLLRVVSSWSLKTSLWVLGGNLAVSKTSFLNFLYLCNWEVQYKTFYYWCFQSNLNPLQFFFNSSLVLQSEMLKDAIPHIFILAFSTCMWILHLLFGIKAKYDHWIIFTFQYSKSENDSSGTLQSCQIFLFSRRLEP